MSLRAGKQRQEHSNGVVRFARLGTRRKEGEDVITVTGGVERCRCGEKGGREKEEKEVVDLRLIHVS